MHSVPVELRHCHVFAGMGGGKRGFNRGKARVKNLRAKPRCIGGIDVDAEAIRKFNAMGPGRAGVVLDMFSLEQYVAFHGRKPPAGWREATPADVRAAFGNEWPHVGFLSAPCKGFSGLLPEALSITGKYQALNALTLRGIWLTLEAYKDRPIPVILFENVPRIATRGRHLLDQIIGLLRAYGYAVAETKHDCGKLGGLAQSRKRFLLIARHIEQVPAFIYEPEQKPLRAVGEVLSKFPLPGHPIAGPMHRMPELQWKTWVRLAFVVAGSDWRSLKRLEVENGFLKDYGLVPESTFHSGAFGVCKWVQPAGVITAGGRPGQGNFSVADPRLDADGRGPRFNNVYRVVRFTDSSPAVTGGAAGTSNAALAVADPKCAWADGAHENKYRVTSWGGAAGAIITTNKGPGSGAQSVADPLPRSKVFSGYSVAKYTGPARTIAGESFPSNGQFAVADPLPAWKRHSNNLKVVDWLAAAPIVIAGGKGVQGGYLSVADPKPACVKNAGDHYLTGGHYGVVPWDRHSNVVNANAMHDNGYHNVADPRLPDAAERMAAVIIAEDGTWHRPFTTLELAGLQSLIDPDERWSPDPKIRKQIEAFERSLWHPTGAYSDSAWREHIGNAVPSDAAEAMAGEIYKTLLAVIAGESLKLKKVPIWVRDVAVALSVRPA